MTPPARRVVTRSPWRTVRLLNYPHLLPAPVEAESSLERDFVRVAALCPGVRRIAHQPFTLEHDNGKYTPDFLVSLAGGAEVVVEVKRRSEVERFRTVFDRAAAVLQTQGKSFFVVTERLIRLGQRAERASELHRYGPARYSEHQIGAVISLVKEHPRGLALGSVRRRLDCSREVLFHLIANRKLTTGPGLALAEAAIVCHVGETPNEIHFDRWFGTAQWHATA